MQQQITISSVLGGETPAVLQTDSSQFLFSKASDPEVNLGGVSGTLARPGGCISPLTVLKKSSTVLTGTPQWIITNPKNTNIYVYSTDGQVLSYTATWGSETDLGDVIDGAVLGAGNGAAYYNNYIYFASTNDIARYGPLDGSPTLANDFWVTTLGKTALNSFSLDNPNHTMFAHVNNKLYICDYINGQGLIHYIQTKKTTAEGDTDDGSTYNALDLPFGYIPIGIEAFGNDLAIIAQYGTDTTLFQGASALFLWDTTSSTFYRWVPIPNGRVGSIKNSNGELYVSVGGLTYGAVLRYLGGYSFETVDFFKGGGSPMSALDTLGNRLIYGNQYQVRTLGYSNPALPSRAKNNVLVNTDTDNFTVVKVFNHYTNNLNLNLAVASPNGIYTAVVGTTYLSDWYSSLFMINRAFRITRVRIPLTDAVDANTIITPYIVVNDGATSTTLPVINNTNYPGKRVYDYKVPPASAIRGLNNFYLRITFTGSAQVAVNLPIEIDIETEED